MTPLHAVFVEGKHDLSFFPDQGTAERVARQRAEKESATVHVLKTVSTFSTPKTVERQEPTE